MGGKLCSSHNRNKMAYTNGSEMANKKRLSLSIYIGNKWLQGNHNWNSSEQYHEQGYDKNPPRCDSPTGLVELYPRNNRTKENKVSQIE